MSSSVKSAKKSAMKLFIKILPKGVDTPDKVIKLLMNVLPIEVLPIQLDKDDKIVLDEDGTFMITEGSHTIFNLEVKSYQFYDRDTSASNMKFSATFEYVEPEKEAPYYDYIMENLINPLRTPVKPSKVALAKLNWFYRGRDYFVMISLFKEHSVVPSQERFKRTPVRDD
jgi:hypothetical protein